jgi:hypothetical protein
MPRDDPEGIMTQRVAIGLTAVNLVLLLALLIPQRTANAQGIPDVLRAHGLEIVDSRGRVRASISISDQDRPSPGPPSNYPPVVIFRLVDQAGKPTVKLETHEAGNGMTKGSGLGLLGDADATQAFIGSDGATTKVRLHDGNGRERTVTP